MSGEEPLLRRAPVNGVRLAYRLGGEGPPVVCIHGSWDDHHSWDGVATRLRASCTVMAYDRRGHSASTAPPTQGHVAEDVADAAALVEALGLAPATVLGHSYGATVALLLAQQRPDLVARLVVHEPPLYGLLAGDDAWDATRVATATAMAEIAEAIERGEVEAAARRFVEEVAFGRGSWRGLLSDHGRATMLANADTWLDQSRDPQRLAVDLTPLASLPVPIAITTGTATLAAFGEIARRLADRLPAAEIVAIAGAAHGAHISHPARFTEVVLARVGHA